MPSLLQSPQMIYVIYTLLALGIFLLLTGIRQFASLGENRTEAKSRRLKLIERGTSTAELLALLKPAPRRGLLTRLPFVGDLPTKLLQAGITIRASLFLALCALFTFFAFMVGLLFTAPHLAGLLAVLAGFALPIACVSQMHQKRRDALIAQLPDALDLMARGLKVGHPLNTSIGAVANEMSDPIGTEFGIIFDQVSYGDDLTDAFSEFAERVNIEDVHYLSASIGIQHGTGGDLSRIIQVLARVIRDRIAMRRKIMAISSEGRLSAWLLSSLPVIIYGFTSLSSPEYYAGVSQDPLYMPMASAIVIFIIANFLILRKLVKFRV